MVAADFKLQNTGQGTAFIWKAGVEVVSATVNTVPVLHFSYESTGSALKFEVSNTGWGDATCNLAIQNPQLEALYPRLALSFSGYLPIGDRVIMTLAHSEAIPDKLAELRRLIAQRGRMVRELKKALRRRDVGQLRRIRRPLFSKSDEERIREIIHKIKKREQLQEWEKDFRPESYDKRVLPADPVDMAGDCLDTNRHAFSLKQEVQPMYNGWDVATFGSVSSRFEIQPLLNVSSPVDTDPTVVLLIDPESVPSEKSYPLSRAIPPGGVERFFIALGATKSAKVQVRFKIYLDQAQLKSDIFVVDLWCPTDCSFSRMVPDGTEFKKMNGTWILPQEFHEFKRLNSQSREARDQKAGED